MTKIEKMAKDAGAKYANPTTNKIEVLGEKNFHKMEKAANAKGQSYHGFRTGAWDEIARDYWWIFRLGKAPYSGTSDLVSQNID